MINDKIVDSRHPLVRHLCLLQAKKIYRRQQQRVLIVGKKTVLEASQRAGGLERLFIGEHHLGWAQHEGVLAASRTVYLLRENLFKKITTLPSPEQVAAEVARPLPSSLENGRYFLGLEGIGDPGNLGTLVRSAVALGFSGLFLIGDCVDLFHDKTLRASKGAALLLPYQVGSLVTLLAWAQEQGVTLYVGSVPSEAYHPHLPTFTPPAMLILGSESHGVSDRLSRHGVPVTIQTDRQMNSLNVAAAGAILMHQMRGH